MLAAGAPLGPLARCCRALARARAPARLASSAGHTTDFAQRHIGPRDSDIREMLRQLGLASLHELSQQTVPGQIRLGRPLRLPEPLSESQLLEELQRLAARNSGSQWRTFIGQGYHDCLTPAPIMRNLFESPGWSSAYTAYQAEIAQGRLESLMNYQTMVADLTGLEVANASLLDEATAAAEALQVCLRRDKSNRKRLLLSSQCHPQTLAVVGSRASALGVRLDYFDELQVLASPAGSLAPEQLRAYSGLLVQYPNTRGHLFALDRLLEHCERARCLSVVATDLLCCALFRPPGDFRPRPDLAVGSSQRLGVPLNYGGPHAGFLACRRELLRSVPGRVVGLTRDSAGQPAYRFALQTREQHIRRDKATSNICTAQALLANMSAMYAVYHGADGLARIAAGVHAKTHLLARMLAGPQAAHYRLLNEHSYFDTLSLRLDSRRLLRELRRRAAAARINLRFDREAEAEAEAEGEAEAAPVVSISLDETTEPVHLLQLARLFEGLSEERAAADAPPDAAQLARVQRALLQSDQVCVQKGLRRSSPFLTHPTFHRYRSEAQLVRYMKRLENKDVSLAHSMIPLGSCTMKLNATCQMLASSWPQFTRLHPFQPADQCQGYAQLFRELEAYLCEITGYQRFSFQPNSGAQGEYAGLRCIKAYLDSLGQSQRDLCLIPVSAHGTNPASAQMAGLRILPVRVSQQGNIELDHLRQLISANRSRLACLMVTYPSTFGVFEDTIAEVCRLVHEAGAQVYLDGANMNAQVGLCRPADYGSDVSHLNLHKTFCIPHGGGGPGVGPIGVKAHLAPFLPGDPLAGGGAGAVAACAWGSPAILPISWSYIRLMSGRGLTKASQVAILNANYMRHRLEPAYKILFKGSHGHVAHEFIIDCRPFKQSANLEAADIAKRLQDFGLHAPTVSWPVANTLMLEPTESEDKEQLDEYCDALLTIRREIGHIESGKLDKFDNPIKNAPHTQQSVCTDLWTRPYSRQQAAFPWLDGQQPTSGLRSKVWPSVGRVDDTYGDTNLFCSCAPVSAFSGAESPSESE